MTIITRNSVSANDEQFRQFVEQFVHESQFGSLTVQDILHNKRFGWVKDLVEQAWQKKQAELQEEKQAEEDRRQAEVNLEKDKEAAQLFATLREQMGLKPLSPEELKEQMESGNKMEADIFPKSEIPAEVIELSQKDKLGRKLPETAFTSPDWAVTFRGWVARLFTKKLMPELSRPDLPANYRQALEDRKRQMQLILSDISTVVVAWGLDPKEARTSMDDFNAMRGEMEVESSRFYWLTQAPHVETEEEKRAREEAKAKFEAQQKIFGELVAKLEARLIETNPELSADDANSMAAKSAKKMVRKYGNSLPEDITTIFREVTMMRIRAANGKSEDEANAKPYANAAGMSDDEFQAAISTAHQERADQAQAQSEDSKRKKAGQGEMKPSTIAAHAADKKGKQGGGKGKKNGHQARQ